MIVSFEKYHSLRQEKLAYRQALIERILDHYQNQAEPEPEDSFFLQHVREGFPVPILENIVARIDQRASGE